MHVFIYSAANLSFCMFFLNINAIYIQIYIYIYIYIRAASPRSHILIFQQVVKMAVSELRFEDKLEKVSNYSSWKERIMLVLMENDIWDFANFIVTPPIEPKELVVHNLKDMKPRRIILDGVKDHLIPHLSGKNSATDMWEALKRLFQSKNENHKMVLREKLRDTKMTGSDRVTSYLIQI
jgi:hypothetical protein